MISEIPIKKTYGSKDQKIIGCELEEVPKDHRKKQLIV